MIPKQRVATTSVRGPAACHLDLEVIQLDKPVIFPLGGQICNQTLSTDLRLTAITTGIVLVALLQRESRLFRVSR